jgi:glutaredoxin 2
MFEHCSFCFRVCMIAALKRMHLQETVVLDDDSDTMVGLIESPLAVNSKLSLDDIRVLPLLRSAAIVKGLRFPSKVRDS